jgi:tRNA-specific 2-thiouridylase
MAPSYRVVMRELFGDAGLDGDYAWLRLDIGGQTIRSSTGEGPGVAGLLRDIRELTLLQAAALPGDALALDALHAAIGEHVTAPHAEDRVAVAMSGGIDSAMALHRTIEAGHEAVGVTLRLWVDPQAPDTERACCSPSSVRAARDLCHARGVPHVALDLRERFREAVVEAFVDGYARGETPNPCVRCNADFRFAELDRFSRRVGASRLATGHYARIVDRGCIKLLARGRDETKDQSYMLAGLVPSALDRLWFPLGDTLKRENRYEAERAGLSAARKPESQEACFLGGADYRDFLERRGLRGTLGALVDESGQVVGQHKGFWRFTPGQRRGLGLGGGERPLYVIGTDALTGTVRVGERDGLACRRIRCESGTLHTADSRGDAKFRYRSPAVAAAVTRHGDGFDLDLDEAVEAVAPGQLAAIYVDDVVVGSGLIAGASPA